MSTNLNQTNQCPSCGRPLPAGALAGLCPACLLAQGAETEQASANERVRFVPPPMEAIAQLFPQLEVQGLLGAGGMGAVYKARQPALDRLVALKVLPAGGGIGSTERFNREARALARLSHPNIVAVHEFGQVEGLHFFIMEFVDGANLRQLEKTARLSPREALQIIPQICDALQYAHDEGVVHRDIKPENVLVDRKGRVKIADFGLAKIAGTDPEAARLTVEGQVMGTPHYMAPEQVERPLAVDHRADIYALGVVFYEMLTGDLPLGKFAPPSRKVQVDVRLDDIVLRALENDPERRYQQASQVKSEVQTVASAPAPKTAESESSAGRPVVAAGFPLVEDRGGQRRIVWKEALRAWAIIFGLLTLAFAFFSAVTGRSLMGWLGIVGWQSLVYRAVIGGTLVVFALKHALRPQTLPKTRHAPGQDPAFWWRSRLLRMGVFVAIAALASTWMVFQDRWIMPGVLGFISGSEYGDLRVAKRASESGTYFVTLNDGSKIELLAMASGDAGPNEWRRPDGRMLNDTGFEVSGLPENQGAGDRLVTRFIFRQPAGAQLLETALSEFTPAAGVSAGGPVLQDGRKLDGAWPMIAAWSYQTNKATLRLGLRHERWRTIAAMTLGEPRRVQTWAQSGEPKWITHFNHVRDDGKDTTVTAMLNSETKNWQLRIIAVDKEGREHHFNQANISPFENTATWTCTFPNLTQDQIKELQVQAKPVHWIEFGNLVLPSPGAGRQNQTHDVALFGPVREITFDALLDLDTGREGSFPPADQGQNPIVGIDQNIAWMQEQGFDIEARNGALGLLGVRVLRLDNDDWDSLTPDALVLHRFNQESMPTELKPAEGALPLTFGFKTREGAAGLMQILAFDPARPGVTLRAKLLKISPARPVLEPPPNFSAEEIAAEPELRFVAWQDQLKSNGTDSVRHPDGTRVTARAELDTLRHERPSEFQVSFGDAGRKVAPFLHLWLAHPAFDRHSLVGLTLVGEDGQPLPLGAEGRTAASHHQADSLSPGLGWIMFTLCPSDDAPPASINVRAEYAVGPLEKTRTVAPDFRGMLALEGGSQLSAIGDSNNGNAFVALTVNAGQLGSRQFGAVAIAKDGQEVAPSSAMRNTTSGSGTVLETFEFGLPLSEVIKFKIGTRPVRTARWENVMLPPLAQ